MKNAPMIIGLVVFLFIGVLVYLFASRQVNTPPQTVLSSGAATSTDQLNSSNLAAETTTATTGINDIHPTRVFNIKATSFSFTPNTIQVNMGDVVELRISSDGDHSFRIDELHIAKSTPPGETTIKFSADQAGTFTFYCGVTGHRELGMVGHLIVK